MSSAESTAGRSLPTNAHRADGTPFYRGGCAKGMPRIGACRTDCLHRVLVEDYRDARRAWEDQRETDRTAPAGVPGAAGSLVSMSQLEDDDYRNAFPPPTFGAWLKEPRS